MQVKIKNKGKVKEFKLIKSWNDVTLENWTKLIQHKTKSKSNEALTIISELSNIPKDIINKLELSDVATIMGQIGKLQSQAFADKWSWFGVMYRLTGGEIVNLKQITELNLLEALTWLTYETDLNSQNTVKYGNN